MQVNSVRFSIALTLCALAGRAAPLLYTFGGDFRPGVGTGAPISLYSMNPASPASVTNVLDPVGDGNTGFNGGLVGVGTLLYGIGNDSNNLATLYSMQTNGTGLTAISSNFNTT